jgi:hypothetical protein
MTRTSPRSAIVLVLLVGLAGSACGRGSRGADTEIPLTRLLRRSATTAWETRRSAGSRLEVEVPRDLCGFVDRPTLGVFIAMHTVPPPPGVFADKKCLLEIQIDRKKQEDLTGGEEAVTNTALDETLRKFQQWALQRHDSVSRFDGGQFSHYRYDVGCPDGDMLSAMATVTNVYEGGVSLYEKDDEAIVRRVFGSLRCLDVPTP